MPIAGADYTASYLGIRRHAARTAAPFIWGAAFIAAAALYGFTAGRGVQWQDSGWQQYRIVTGQLEHPRGLAVTHPLHFHLSRLSLHVPGLEPAHAITLISALFGAITVANLAVLIYVLNARAVPRAARVRGDRAAIAAICAGAFMTSHTFWQHATHTESYTLVAALLTGEWLCLTCFALRGRPALLAALALLNGLGVGNHLLAALATPLDVGVICWAIVARRAAPRWAFACAALWLLGAMPYLTLVVKEALRSGDWAATLHSALFAKYSVNVLNTSFSLRSLGLLVGYYLYNFPGLTLPLALLGLIRPQAPVPVWLLRVLMAEIAIYFLFVARYSITDQYSFYFPVYAGLTIFAGLGLARLLAAGRSRLWLILAALTACWTPLIYWGAATGLARAGWLEGMAGAKPYRDGYRAFFVPWGVGEDYPTQLNEEISRLAAPGDLIILADHMSGFGVRYWQALGRLPQSATLHELTVRPGQDELAELQKMVDTHRAAGRNVILTPRDRNEPGLALERAAWERVGDIYIMRAVPE